MNSAGAAAERARQLPGAEAAAGSAASQRQSAASTAGQTPAPAAAPLKNPSLGHPAALACASSPTIRPRRPDVQGLKGTIRQEARANRARSSTRPAGKGRPGDGSPEALDRQAWAAAEQRDPSWQPRLSGRRWPRAGSGWLCAIRGSPTRQAPAPQPPGRNAPGLKGFSPQAAAAIRAGRSSPAAPGSARHLGSPQPAAAHR